MKLADRLSALPTTSFRSCAFDCDHQVTALVDLGFQDANIRYFQWNGYLGFAHGWFYSVFPAILHPHIWGLPRQFPMSPFFWGDFTPWKIIVIGRDQAIKNYFLHCIIIL
jgi:hypothetical protein